MRALLVLAVALLAAADPADEALQPNVDLVASEAVKAAVDANKPTEKATNLVEAEAEAKAKQFTDYPFIDNADRDVEPPLPNGTKYSSASGKLKGCKGRPDGCAVETEWCELDHCNMWQHAGRDSMALVTFYAEWCPVCKDFDVQFSILRNKYDPFTDVLVARVNGDENPTLMTDFGIDEYPTTILFNRDCYWSDKGCLDQLQWWKYSGESNDHTDIIRWIDQVWTDRRIELATPMNAPYDQGPCPGVAADLRPEGAPCPGMSPPGLDELPPEAGKTNLFGEREMPVLPPSPNLPPPNGGIYPGNAKGWEKKLTREMLDKYYADGKINEVEYGLKKIAMGFEKPDGTAIYVDYEDEKEREKLVLHTEDEATAAAKLMLSQGEGSGAEAAAAEADPDHPKFSYTKAVEKTAATKAAAAAPPVEEVPAGALLQENAMAKARPVCKVTEKPKAHLV